MSKTMYDLYQENPEKELKDEFLEDVLDLLTEEDLQPYIRNFQMKNGEEEPTLGNYSMSQKTLTIHKRPIERQSLEGYSSALKAIEAIKSGIEAARNTKMVEEGREDITSKIVRIGLMDYAIEKGFAAPTTRDMIDPFYLPLKMKENEHLNPASRLVNINAWKYMVNLLKNQRTSQELLTSRVMLYYAYIMGYQNNGYHLEAPTQRFLLETRMIDDFYDLRRRIQKEDYSLDTRLNCGLPITQEEYDKKILQKVRLQKKKSND